MTEMSEPSDTTGTTPTATRAYRAWVPTPDAVRPMLVDVIAVTALSLLVLVGFDPAYGGGLWLTVGAIGVVAGLATAYVSIQAKLSPLTTVLVTLAGFVVFGGHAVPDTAIAGFLPGLATPGALFDGITRGWARLLTTVPLVGTADHLAAIVYLGGFIAAAGGLQLARRTRSIWLPVVPALVVGVAAILVGTDTPAATLIQGAGVAIVIVVWASLRGARTRPRVHIVGSKAWSRRLTATCFVALVIAGGVLVAPTVPFAGPNDRYVLRHHTQPPFDPNNYPSPLSSYKYWRVASQKGSKLRDTTLLTVQGLPEGVPVRLASMDVYDGNVWLVGSSSNGGSTTGSGKFVRVGSGLTAGFERLPGQSTGDPSGTKTNATVRITVDDPLPPQSVWVPVVSGIENLSFAGSRSPELDRALRFNRVTDTAAVPSTMSAGDQVAEQAAIPLAAYIGGAKRKALVGDAPADQAVYQPPIPSSKDDKVDSMADRIVDGTTSDYDKAAKLEAALTKKGDGIFNDGLKEVSGNPASQFPAGHDLHQLDQFVGARNPANADQPMFIGNAERFAATMAAMARHEGLPARVVVGFREHADDKHPAERKGTGPDSTVYFTANDADAWVEIAFKGVGWVGFYPTPPRSQNNVPKQKPKTQSPSQADVQARPPVSPPLNPATLQDQIKTKAEKHHKAASLAGFEIPAWVWLLLKIIFYPLIVIALVVAAITGVKRWRRVRRRSRGSPVDRIAGAWAEMLDQLRDLGSTVPRRGTRLEVAGGVAPDTWEELPGFAAGIDAAMFGPEDPDDESVASIWDYVDSERFKLLDALERKRRWLAKLSLRSLKPWR